MKTTLVAVSIRLLATALLSAAAVPASAQSEEIVAHVPFNFVVGTTPMTAGTYVVKPMGDDPGIVSIESADGRHVALTVTIPGRSELPLPKPELVFEKRGDQYVLARVRETDGIERDIAPRALSTTRNVRTPTLSDRQ